MNTQFELTSSRQFISWLQEQRASLAFTTYQAGRLFLIGVKSPERLSIFERAFNRSMGLYATPETLYLSSLYQIWRFENSLYPGQFYKNYDRLYVPQLAYTTGDIDTHDLVVDKSGRVVFINTLFSCLATVNERYSFEPLWQPPFISKLAGEDRCHLNGLAMRDGEVRYVTTVSQTDIYEGWRTHRHNGGTVIDVPSHEIILTGLSMPHSPRYYQGKLWLLNSGTGYFGYVDLDKGQFEPVTFCPGYLRGLTFIEDFAIVGLSKPREKTFSGLPLEDNLKAKHIEARCGLQIIDLRSGDIVHALQIEGLISELYDVAVLPGVQRPMALGLKTDEIRRVITIPPTNNKVPALINNPQGASKRIEAGKNALKQGNPNEAVRQFHQAISQDANAVFAYIGLAQAQQQQAQYDAAIANLNQALALKPNSATAHLILGNVLSDMAQLDNAIAHYQQALHYNPNYAQAYNNLGLIFKKQDKLDLAQEYYQKALTLKPNDAIIYNNLATVFEAKWELEKAIEQYQKALSLNPEYVEVYQHLGNVFVEQFKLEQAIEYFEKAIAIKPDYADAHFNKAFVLLMSGNFLKGWQEHTWRRYRVTYLEALNLNPLETKIPLFPDNLVGEMIILETEQGIGDELFFLRFALTLKQRGAKIGYRCSEKIKSLLKRQSWIDELICVPKSRNALENHLLIGDLPLALGMNEKTQIPPPLPLSILSERREAMQNRLAAIGSPPYIGITWWAGTKPEQQKSNPLAYREIDLPLLAEALRPIHATFLVLQRNPTTGEIETLANLLDCPLHDFSEYNNDLEDMLALLDLLDDYICVHNTNIHLMAGINKTARILIPHPPEWRDMIDGDESPWFKGFKLYRQGIDKDWTNALRDLTKDLKCTL